jgi:hypothetical protein
MIDPTPVFDTTEVGTTEVGTTHSTKQENQR